MRTTGTGAPSAGVSMTTPMRVCAYFRATMFSVDCLQDIINSPNGHICPICRCIWYGLSWTLTDLRHWIVLQLFLLRQQLYGYYDSLPPYIKTPFSLAVKLFKFVLSTDNPYYWADMIVSQWTNLYAHNPNLDLLKPRMLMDVHFLTKGAFLPLVYGRRLSEDEDIAYTFTASSVPFTWFLYLFKPSGGCNNIKDACILALVLLVSSVIAHLIQYWRLLYLSNLVLALHEGLCPFLFWWGNLF